jgi:hypothetical protein
MTFDDQAQLQCDQSFVNQLSGQFGGWGEIVHSLFDIIPKADLGVSLGGWSCLNS